VSEPKIILHADHTEHEIEIRCGAIDVIQPVMMGDYFRYSNVQVANRIYQVRESRAEIEALRAAAEADAANG
jgi:hypothetical protein